MPSNEFKCAILVLFLALALLPAAHAQSNGTNGTGNSTGNVTATPSPTPSPSVSAVEEESSYYLEGGEEKEIRDFDYQGSSYHMVVVDGEEALLFDNSANIITEEVKIKELAGAYANSLDNPFKQANLDSIKTSVAELDASYTYCGSAYYNFTKGIWN